METWFLIALIGVFGQVVGALTAAYFAYLAAQKLASAMRELNYNTRLTESVKATTEDTNHAVKNGQAEAAVELARVTGRRDTIEVRNK